MTKVKVTFDFDNSPPPEIPLPEHLKPDPSQAASLDRARMKHQIERTVLDYLHEVTRAESEGRKAEYSEAELRERIRAVVK